jgi:inorganic pyrophosphatase
MELEVVIEIPRWSFLKRGSTGKVDFVLPFPCLFNYGSVRDFLGGDGDCLDAIVLGPRLARGTRVKVRVHGAIGLSDRGMYDDKLVCSGEPLRRSARRQVLIFMKVYGVLKRVLDFLRRRPARTACEGWNDERAALSRARPLQEGTRLPEPVPF